MGTDSSEHQFSADMSSQFKAMGFEPGWPVIEMAGYENKFTIDDVFEALRTSRYSSPRTIVMHYDAGEDNPDVQLGFVPELIQAVYRGPLTAGWDDQPGWYVKGRVISASLKGEHPYQAHVFFSSNHEEGKLQEEFYLQLVVKDLLQVDPDIPLAFLPRGVTPGLR